MSREETALAVRRGAGLFTPNDRGLLSVEGGDRRRWLDGMISNDVTRLAPGAERSGCYAALLTRQGRIVSDLHVLLRPEAYWLELAAPAAPIVLETLQKFIVADDVALRDRAPETARLGLEGPAAGAILGRALGAPVTLAPDACLEVELAGAPVVLGAWGASGLPGFQLFAPAAAGPAVRDALLRAGAQGGLVEADAGVLELLRIESGLPRFGTELGPDVLPAEARLERAVSTTKGCYTGQEVVERMRSRGRPAHLLVGLALAGEPPPPGAVIRAGERDVGEVTSACRSPSCGAIALAFVRREHAEPGGAVEVQGSTARVAALPFVAPDSAGTDAPAAGAPGR